MCECWRCYNLRRKYQYFRLRLQLASHEGHDIWWQHWDPQYIVFVYLFCLYPGQPLQYSIWYWSPRGPCISLYQSTVYQSRITSQITDIYNVAHLSKPKGPKFDSLLLATASPRIFRLVLLVWVWLFIGSVTLPSVCQQVDIDCVNSYRKDYVKITLISRWKWNDLNCLIPWGKCAFWKRYKLSNTCKK